MVKKKSTKKSVRKSVKKSAKNSVKKAVKKSVKKKSSTAQKKGKKSVKKAVKKAVQKAKAPARKTRKSGAGRTASAPSKKRSTKKKQGQSARAKVLQKIKQGLLSQREALLREAEEALNSLPGEINFPDMGDQATAETDRNFMLRLRDRERMLLKKIDEAVERIDSNSYGICTACGSQIGVKRLEARPVTNLCIECKTRQEEEEKIIEG
jgi:DnaK suppressor protein